MTGQFQINRRLAHRTLGTLLILSLAGCGRDDIKVYRVAKTDAPAPAPQIAAAGMTPPTSPGSTDQGAAPQIKWTVPAGWQEKPATEMRLASFSAPGTHGQTVDVSVVPLPGMAGGDLSNVNRWRGQVGLDPIQEDDLARLGEQVTVGDTKAPLFDMAGMPAGTTGKARILAVGVHRADLMWFFKATGDDESVGLQKTNFISFLSSIQFIAATDATDALPADHPPIDTAAPAMPSAAPDTGTASLPTWTVPPAWQPVPPTQMLLAKFTATEQAAQAEITVSSFPGDVGGLLANINRWRGQISLPPVDDSSLSQNVTSLDTAAGPASQTDLSGVDAKTGRPARMIGVILPLNGQTWFYKLMGDTTVVAHQKADFLKFVQSVKY